ncbi:MAG: glutaminyl-peptide cyclotransferase [Bacteroidales bacterium]|nr:glutaminyl-peptide cyclotransferase [Bacteroidales bacterium]
MMNKYFNLTLSSILFFALFQITGCSQDKRPGREHTGKPGARKTEIAAVVSPSQGSMLVCGETIPVNLHIKDKTATIDSVILTAGAYYTGRYTEGYQAMEWITENAPVGQNILKITICYNNSQKESHSVAVTLLSDIVPKLYKYSVVNTYPHDVNAYTQGLIYDKGTLLESTGQNGKSSLRRVEIETGRVMQMVPLDEKFFGEGIALVNDKIFQVTWKSQTGFVYSKDKFEVLRTFNFPYYEGWGLTSYAGDIYMSDGSSFIYVIEPEYFTQLRQIDVLSHKGRIRQINELEYINGKILANVLGETYIIVVDPKSGKVTGEIELGKIVPKGLEGEMNRVLNGIAYNPVSKRLYVTGKLWPVLYEIEIEGGI